MTLPPKLPADHTDETRPPCTLHPSLPAVTRDGEWLMCEQCSLQDLPLAVERFRHAVSAYEQSIAED